MDREDAAPTSAGRRAGVGQRAAADPTRLPLRTYRSHSPAAALRALAAGEGITAGAEAGQPAGDRLRWQRYEGRKAGEPALSVEIAVAQAGADTHVVALVARRAELERLVRAALVPAHALQSATKSVTSTLFGIAAHQDAASGFDATTPVLRLAAAVDYRPEHIDARKRAMTVEDMLTMQSGLAWKESGYAYEPGRGSRPSPGSSRSRRRRSRSPSRSLSSASSSSRGGCCRSSPAVPPRPRTRSACSARSRARSPIPRCSSPSRGRARRALGRTRRGGPSDCPAWAAGGVRSRSPITTYAQFVRRLFILRRGGAVPH